MGRGEVLARLGPERHETAAKAAAEAGMSLNAFICKAIDAALEGGGMPSSEAREQALAEVADIAARLRGGFVLVPADEAEKSHWDQMMGAQKK
jgi:LmbE family N-acetylglucosaminyl deacetylase